GFIFALLAFAAGFAVRPFGALIFGRLGDLIGRKYTFLITMTLMFGKSRSPRCLARPRAKPSSGMAGRVSPWCFSTRPLNWPGSRGRLGVAVAVAMALLFFFVSGPLPVGIGRRPIMRAGFALGAFIYFPIFRGTTHSPNPNRGRAPAAAPVPVTADPKECSF